MATALISSGTLKPCHTARSYSGIAGPRVATAATCRIGSMLTPGTLPTTRQASTSSSTGKRIQRGGSWGARGSSRAGGPKKMPMKRSE